MADVKVTAKMRQVAPELCAEIDKLRATRKPMSSRLIYLVASKADEAASKEISNLNLGISKIDAEVATLHAQAREQFIIGIAKTYRWEQPVSEAPRIHPWLSLTPSPKRTSVTVMRWRRLRIYSRVWAPN